MRVKITGIGKCGVRVAYDFFAYTKNLASAYEIRLGKAQNVLSKVLSDFGLQTSPIKIFRQNFKKLLDDFKGLYRIAEQPDYVTIESDSKNNEIIGQSLVFKATDADGNVNETTFPAQNFDLNAHKGGCNFHIMSESLARTWKSIPPAITDSEQFDIFITSFSIAGGTGGGSSQIICREAKSRRNTQHDCHFMGLGVLPTSDEKYQESDIRPTMPDYEKFSTGRFLTSIYSSRVERSMNSVWLFSNDILRFVVPHEFDKPQIRRGGAELKVNLSLVNYYVAESLTLLANSSSRVTSAEENLDPKELNHFLAGKPFMSAFCQRYIDKLTDEQNAIRATKSLVLGALTNASVNESGGLEGLSVPVKEAHLEQLKCILDDENVNRRDFVEALNRYDPYEGPTEYFTCSRLIILHGQPRENHSHFKSDLVKKICDAIFPNSAQVPYSFRYEAEIETLLLFLVDPLISSAERSIYFYVNHAWTPDNRDYFDELQSIVAKPLFKKPKFLMAEERFPSAIYGGAMKEISKLSTKTPEVLLKREHVIDTVQHLHDIFHRRRPSKGLRPSLRPVRPK